MGRQSKVWKYFNKDQQNKDKVNGNVCEVKLSSKGQYWWWLRLILIKILILILIINLGED